MTKKRTGINTLAYMGVEATAPPNSVVADVDPTSEDVAGFDLGSFWITRKSRNVWVMVSKDAGEAIWGKLYPDAGGAISFPCDIGTATQAGGVLNVKGDGTSISTDGTTATTVTIGLATNVTVAGTLTVPNLWEGVVYSDINGLLSTKASISNGEVLISSAAGEPLWKPLTAGTNIGIYEAANAIGIEVTGILPIARGGTNSNTMVTTYGVNYFDGTSLATTAVGTATHVLTSNGAGVAPTFQASPGAGVATVTGGISINITGTAADPIINLDDITDHSLIVGSGAAAMTELGVATDGQIPIGSSAADPVLGTITPGAGMSVTNAAGSITIDNQLTLNAQVGVAYTMVLADAGKLITCDNAAAIALTIPPAASVDFPIGTQMIISQKGAGTVTLTPGAGVTISSADGLLDTYAQYSLVALIKVDGDLWYAGGDLN